MYSWLFNKFKLEFILLMILMRNSMKERKWGISDFLLYSGTIKLFLMCMMPYRYASFIEIQYLLG